MISPKENLLRAIHRKDPEWVPNDLESTIWLYPPYVERPNLAGQDGFGVWWNYEAGAEGGTYPRPEGYPVHNLKRWHREIHIPDVEAMDWNQIQKGWMEGEVDLAAIDRDANLVVGIVEMGLFERSCLLLGMENALVGYLAEPEQMSALVGAVADFKIEVIRHFYIAARPDIIWFGDDWGTQNNLFIRPALWRRIIKPHLQRVYECIQDCGMIVYQHSCGRVEAVIGDIVDLGADVWNPCQPCNDLAGLKKRFGDQLTFHGGIDSQFVLGRAGVTPEEVRLEVRLRIDEMAEGGGYIAGPSHCVPYDPVILTAMEDEIHTYGRAVYQR